MDLILKIFSENPLLLLAIGIFVVLLLIKGLIQIFIKKNLFLLNQKLSFLRI